jgi:hypothetical protein
MPSAEDLANMAGLLLLRLCVENPNCINVSIDFESSPTWDIEEKSGEARAIEGDHDEMQELAVET